MEDDVGITVAGTGKTIVIHRESDRIGADCANDNAQENQ
jgi:hypothetical protein